MNIHLEFRGLAGFTMDRNLTTVGHDQAQQAMKSAMTKSMPWLETSSITWRYEPRRRIFSEDILGSGKVDWSKDVGNSSTLWYQMSDSDLGQLPSFKRDAAQDQTAPYAVAYPFYNRSVTTVRLPPGIRFGHRGDSLSLTYGGVQYTRRVVQTGDTVAMYRGVRSLEQEISAKDAAADQVRRPDLNAGPAWVWAVPPVAPADPKAAVKPADAKPMVAAAPSPTDERALVSAALTDSRGGLNDKALDEVNKALAIKPGWPDALRARGSIYYAQGRYSEAADAFAATIKASTAPDEGLYLARLTDLSLAGRLDEAVQAGDAALSAFPKSLRVRVDRAENFSRRREFDKALAEVDEAQRLAPDDLALPAQKAEILWAMDKHDEAIAFIEAAVAGNPDNSQALAARGLFEGHLKHFEAAHDDLEEALAMNPEDQGAVARLADLEAQRGDFPAAVARLDAALAKWPTSVNLLNSRCWIRALSGDKLDLAAKDCDAALTRNPNYAAAMDSRAFVSFRQKKFADAVQRYDAVLKIRPNQAASLYGRGLAKLRAGDKPGGDADLAAAVKLSATVAEPFAEAGVRP